MPQFLRPDADITVAGWRRETFESGTAQAGGATTITLAAGASATDDFYNDRWIEIMSGTGVGGLKRITDYVGSTKVATVDSAWTTNPASGSGYEITQRLFEGIDEVTLSSADYAISPVSPTSAKPMRVSLSVGTDPNSVSPHTLHVWVRKDLDGGARIDVTVEIYDASTSTLITSSTLTNIVSTTTEMILTLTVAEINAITTAAYQGQLETKVIFTEIP